MLNLRTPLAAAALAVSLASCGNDADTAASASSPSEAAATSPARPTSIDVATCLRGAGIKPAKFAAELKFTGTGILATDASGETASGQATASFYDDAKSFTLYAVAKPGQEMSQTAVRDTPETYEFVGYLKATSGPEYDAADDCLDGELGG